MFVALCNPSINSRILSSSRECGKAAGSPQRQNVAGCSLVQLPNSQTQEKQCRQENERKLLSLPTTLRQVRAWLVLFLLGCPIACQSRRNTYVHGGLLFPKRTLPASSSLRWSQRCVLMLPPA